MTDTYIIVPGSRTPAHPQGTGLTYFDPEPSPQPTHDWPDLEEMYFRLVDPQLGELDLACDYGYTVRSYEFGSPEIRNVVYNASLDDGTYDLTRFIGARSLTMDIVFNPENVQISEAALRDQLLRFLHPSARPTLYFSIHGDDRIRKVELRGAEMGWLVSVPQFNSMQASWQVPKGVIEDVGPTCAMFEFGTSLPAEWVADIDNDGTAPAHWTATIAGAELNNPSFELGGKKLSLDFTVPAGGSVVIDSRTKTVKVGGQATGYKYLNDESSWFMLPVGTSQLKVSHGGVSYTGGTTWAYWQPDAANPTNWQPDAPTDSRWTPETVTPPGGGTPIIPDGTIEFCYTRGWL